MMSDIARLHTRIDMLERMVEQLHRELDEIERDEASRRAVDQLPDCVAEAMMADQVDEYVAA